MTLPERIANLAQSHGLRPVEVRRPVVREGSRNVWVRRKLIDGEAVLALYGLGHRHLYWRMAED